ncbi:MAG: hypothetical protein ABIR32_14715 [Ilumatobacteraceae bacterium]
MDQGSVAQRSTAVIEPVPSAGGCPVAHDVTPAAVSSPVGCPVAHAPVEVVDEPGVCPFPHKTGAARVIKRSKADMVVRTVLRIRERPEGATSKAAYAAFQKSMLISATRCTLTYVVFPFVVPAVGFATGVGPILGIVIGLIAMTCDVFTIRRFFAIDHKWRWHFSAVALSVITLLSVLMVQDIVHLVTT